MMIDEIEQKIINILPTSNTMFDEIDYSILEKRKEDWIKLSEITHSIVLVFDCYTNKWWVLSIPFFISCIRQQNPLTVLSKIILRKVKQFNLPPPKKK